MAHPIENMMKTTMEQLCEMVDVNTIIGDPIITTSETMVLPVSKVSMAFLSGGGEYQKEMPVKKGFEPDEADSRFPFAGTSIAGMSITPVAFLSVNAGSVKVLHADCCCTLDRVVELAPEFIKSISDVISSNKAKCSCEDEEQA